MIRLHDDCLLFQTSTGETIPCSVELVATELLSGNGAPIDPELIRQAAAAVLHYFKHDLGRSSVSVADFASALERVLKALGMKINSWSTPPPKTVAVSDLQILARDSGKAFELAFFPQLRDEVRSKLTRSPHVLRFEGLRGCVKQLLGARRWSSRCQELNDQIVDYLRECLTNEGRGKSCGLVVS